MFDNSFEIRISEAETVRCESFPEFIDVLRRIHVFNSFQCNPYFCDEKGKPYLRTGVSFDQRIVTIDIASDNGDMVDAGHRFLKETFNLRNPEIPPSPDDRPKHLHPTVFVGRHFDHIGQQYYSALSTFLELLGFEVKQGEEYTSTSIPEKVKARIDSQDIFIGLVSGEREHSWLIAEPSYALGRGKHVLLLVENEASYSPTLLGKDLEQVRFDRGQIEKTFIP